MDTYEKIKKNIVCSQIKEYIPNLEHLCRNFDVATRVFKVNNTYKCYATVRKDNKIIYLSCKILEEDEDLKSEIIQKRNSGYYLKR